MSKKLHTLESDSSDHHGYPGLRGVHQGRDTWVHLRLC